MDARIRQLRDHYVVCGFGRTGRAVCDNLVRGGRDLVVIEHDPEALLLLREADHLFVRGNATDDECLHRARIDHAAGLVAALGSDADNVYLVLSARQIKPDLAIVSWAASMESERKLLRAGANHAISPYMQSGQRMANLLATPHALEFMDHVLGGSDNIRLGEFAVESGSRLQNHSLIDAGIRRDVGVIVIGIRRADGTLEFNPPADTVLHENDVV
ncbi:MAG: potassium channel protein, partial [Gammaproteobacteria bacterium]|nr:potassium channel protein [Gammaproteobacteria bacterium]NIR99361.1 potassium channel protein [Gammaproteobacteria bacterium]